VNRLWYIWRNGQVFGPATDAQLAHLAATGRLLPTDLLNIAGEPNWWPVMAIPELLPSPLAAPQPGPRPEPEPETELEPCDSEEELDTVSDSVMDDESPAPQAGAGRVIRITCFSCFCEVSVAVVPGARTLHCPKCRAAIEPSVAAAPPPANQAAFAGMESPGSSQILKRRIAGARPSGGRNSVSAADILGSIGDADQS